MNTTSLDPCGGQYSLLFHSLLAGNNTGLKEMRFNRFDICEAYLALEMDFHIGGILQERRRCLRGDLMSVNYQLKRMGFSIKSPWNGYDSLSENGKDIYHNAIVALEIL